MDAARAFFGLVSSLLRHIPIRKLLYPEFDKKFRPNRHNPADEGDLSGRVALFRGDPFHQRDQLLLLGLGFWAHDFFIIVG